MTSPRIQRWIKRSGRQSARYRSIYSLIFGIDAIRYFIYRTRLQFANLVARIGLHAMEYFLIFHTIPAFLLPVMLMRVAVIAIESGWWGMMDGMRQRIRTLNEKSDAKAIRLEIEDWLALAQRLSLIVIIAAIAAIIIFTPSSSKSVIILAMSIYLATRLILRTLYSGVYALKRIYIRFEWIVGAELLVFATAWFLKPVLGEWTIPTTIIVAGTVSSLISYYFIRRSLEFMRITPSMLFAPLDFSRIRGNYNFKQLGAPGIAMIAIKLHDIALILSLQFASMKGMSSEVLLFAFYLIIPAVRACMGWAQILYFDLVRNQLDSFRGLRSYFERVGLVYAIGYGSVISMIAGGVLLYSLPESVSYISLICMYLVLSSVLGLIQISLFSRQRYYILTAIAFLQYGLFFLMFNWDISFAPTYLISIAVPSVLGLLLMLSSAGRIEHSDLKYLQWVKKTLAITSSHRLAIIELDSVQSRHLKKQISAHFKNTLGCDVSCCFHKNYFLALSEEQGLLGDDKVQMLIAHGAGHVVNVFSHVCADGHEVMQILFDKYGLPGAINIRNTQDVINEFKQLFSSGMVQIPTKKNSALLKLISKDEIYPIVRNVLAFSEGGTAHTEIDLFTTSLQHEGEIEAIFLVRSKDCTQEQRKAWLDYISGHSKELKFAN